MDMVFDDSHARELFGPAGIRCPHLTDYFPRLIGYARAAPRSGQVPRCRRAGGGVVGGGRVAGAHERALHAGAEAGHTHGAGNEHRGEVHDVRVAGRRG